MSDTGKVLGLIKALGAPDPEVIEGAVSDWLEEHPEATTTVEDGAITKAKLDSSLQGTVDDVDELKSQINEQFGGNAMLLAKWMQGNYTDASENPPTSYNSNTARIRSKIIVNANTKLTLNCLSGYKYTYSLYVDDVRKEYHASSWVGTNKTFEYGAGEYVLYISIARTGSGNLSPEQARGCIELFADNAVPSIYDAIDDNKDNLDAIRTATTSDVGKLLKAKTVTDGKVTEWEYFSDADIYDKIAANSNFIKDQFVGNTLFNWEWKQAAYADLSENPPTNISTSNIDKRIRTKITVSANKRVVLSCKNGYAYNYSLYVDSTRKEYDANHWLTDNQLFEYGSGTYELYLNLKNSAGTTIVPSDAEKGIVVVIDDGLVNVTDAIADINGRFGAKNLFNRYANNTLRGYYQTDDTWKTSDEYGQTDFIEIVPGERYTSPIQDVPVIWYDSSKDLLSYTGGVSFSSNGYVTAPSGAKYARFMFEDATQTSFYVRKYLQNEKELLMEQVPYGIDNQYKGLKAVAFGTSLSYRAQSSSGYLEFLPIMAQMDVDNQGIGNSTIMEHSSHTDMMGAITGYQSYSDKDVVLVEGFVNDWYDNHAYLGTWKDDDNTTVCGCVRLALTHILTQKPTATVILIFDHYGQLYNGVDCSSTVEKSGRTQFEFYEEIAKVAESLGIPVIKGYAISGMSELTPEYFIDNIHPNMLGSKQFADVIWSCMKNIPVKSK